MWQYGVDMGVSSACYWCRGWLHNEVEAELEIWSKTRLGTNKTQTIDLNTHILLPTPTPKS